MTAPTDAGSAPAAETVWRPSFDISVYEVLGTLRRGPGDPCQWYGPRGELWRTSRMPSGPVSYRLAQLSRREVHAAAWGAGADQFIATLPRTLGADDNPEDFRPDHPLLAEAQRRAPGLRLTRTDRVLEALVPAVLEQKVTGKQAFAAWSWLVRRYGEPAPGPTPVPMWVTPDVAAWRLVPSWDWHRAGVEPARSATIQRAMAVMGRLQECVNLTPDDARRRLHAVPGIGPWTAAEIAQRALGDPDAVSVGDYHLAGFVGWALLGRKVDDATMLELLEPWRGHRHRAIRLLQVVAPMPPRRGPRLTIQDHRRH